MHLSKLSHHQRTHLQGQLRAVVNRAESLITLLEPKEGHAIDEAALTKIEAAYRRDVAAVEALMPASEGA